MEEEMEALPMPVAVFFSQPSRAWPQFNSASASVCPVDCYVEQETEIISCKIIS